MIESKRSERNLCLLHQGNKEWHLSRIRKGHNHIWVDQALAQVSTARKIHLKKGILKHMTSANSKMSLYLMIPLVTREQLSKNYNNREATTRVNSPIDHYNQDTLQFVQLWVKSHHLKDWLAPIQIDTKIKTIKVLRILQYLQL